MKDLCVKPRSSTKVTMIRGNVCKNSKVNAENCQKNIQTKRKARFSSEELPRYESLPWLSRIPNPLHERSCSMHLSFQVSILYSLHSSHGSTHLRHPKPLHTPQPLHNLLPLPRLPRITPRCKHRKQQARLRRTAPTHLIQ
jgi:hypothetical protein